MMKGLMINEQTFAEENMSNITSASGEASLSSSNRNDNFSTTPQVKRKRNQAGNPDPEAEVIALSPRSLMATNRFVCEICGKGFQRDQNLQLHRRGHNLPWKLKKRANNEVIRKKVYVCPESSCIHHDPTRALGDLTGIKKHFCRKHGEKKWKCEKCSKRYAVQSDWKAHSKTCGTKEYRCECGTLFSRRDSFITHRAFCDTLAVESGRSSAMLTGNNPISLPSHINLQFQQPHYFSNTHDTPSPLFSMKKEEQPSDNLMNMRHEIPPWLMSSQPLLPAHHFSPPIFQTSNKLDQDYYHEHDESTNPNMVGGPHEAHVSAVDSGTSKQTGQFGLNLSSREELTYSSGRLGSYKAATTVASGMMMTSFPFADDHGFAGGSTFEDAFTGFTNNNLNSKKENEDMTTKDFLSLRHDHSDIFNIAGLVTSTHQHPHFQNHKTWDN